MCYWRYIRSSMASFILLIKASIPPGSWVVKLRGVIFFLQLCHTFYWIIDLLVRHWYQENNLFHTWWSYASPISYEIHCWSTLFQTHCRLRNSKSCIKNIYGTPNVIRHLSGFVVDILVDVGGEYGFILPLYLVRPNFLTVLVGKSYSDLFTMGPHLYGREPLLVWNGGSFWNLSAI